MTPQLHITSLVVHAAPSRMHGVASTIAAIAGAQVHASAPGGKIVVTLEAGTSEEMVSKVNAIQRTPGVLSAVLVYEAADSLEAMNEEVPDGDDATGVH